MEEIMTWIYELRNITNQYPLIWVVLFIVITVISEIVVFTVKKESKAKPAIASVIISAIITATFAATFNLLIGNPTIKNDPSVIPDDIYRTECHIVLLDYYGEYYYLPESKNKYFINDDLKVKATKIELINEDYDVVFDNCSISKNERDENVYIFKNIPAGNYTLNVYVDGYMKRSETVVFDTGEISVNYKTGKKWWSVHPVMVKNNEENTYSMNVWFLDHNEKPIENISYKFVGSKKTYSTVYSYPQKTDEDGSIKEIICIYDNAQFWIAYKNPITSAEEIFCVTSKVDKDSNKCDAILIFDSNGNLKQTSPEELWYNFDNIE